jgi:hypothetical protein
MKFYVFTKNISKQKAHTSSSQTLSRFLHDEANYEIYCSIAHNKKYAMDETERESSFIITLSNQTDFSLPSRKEEFKIGKL